MLTWEYESFAFAFGLNCINKQLTRREISGWRVRVWGEYLDQHLHTMSNQKNLYLTLNRLAQTRVQRWGNRRIISVAIGYVLVTAWCPLIVVSRHLYPVGLQGRFLFLRP